MAQASIRIFLSAASAEFGSYREALQQHLTSRGRSVDIQEDFSASGTPTLDKLAGYIEGCDVVVHLVGEHAGAPALPRSVEALNRRYPDFGERFPVLAPHLEPGGPALSYTQWEAWLGLYHRKPVIVARPAAGAPRGPESSASSEADRHSQARHLDLLASQECHREILFKSVENLAIELHKALAELPPRTARPLELPPVAGYFVGRAQALAELVRRLGQGESLAVVGTAGFGKTALAARALRQMVGGSGERLASSPWPDGVMLLDLYAQRGLADAAWHALVDRLKGVEFLNDKAAPQRAQQALRGERLLIVVEGAEVCDGQEGRSDLAALQAPAPASCRWLVLTRQLQQADPQRRVWLQDRLADDEAGALLDGLTGQPLPVDLRSPLLALLQGHPLALTWAGKLMARGDEDPRWLLHEWQAGDLPSLADPMQEHHTLAWLFERSVSRLGETSRAALAVAGCLASTAVPLGAFVAGLGMDKGAVHATVRGLAQHGLMRPLSGAWQFTHALAYGYARERHPAGDAVRQTLAAWLRGELKEATGETGRELDSGATAACLEHAGALLKRDAQRQLWWVLLVPLLYDVRDRLLALGWSAQVEAALISVEQGMASLGPDASSDPKVEREQGVLRNRQADLALLRGDLAGAGQAYRAALAVRERLARADPSNAQWQRDLSVSQDNIGQVLRAQGDLAGAEQAYRAALAVRERLAKADPSNAQWQRDLSVSQNNIGEVLSAQGDLARAEQAYRAALAVAERLATADPSNAQWQRDLSVSKNNIGRVLSAQGDLAGAEQAYRVGLAVVERLWKADPSNAQWQRDLSVSQELIGNVLSAQGDLAGAEQVHRAALAVRERLAKADPSNAEWQRDLFCSLWVGADIQARRGSSDEALPLARRCLSIAERLAALDPRNATWQEDVKAARELVSSLGG